MERRPVDSEREELDALVQSAGWRLFCENAAREWGTTEGGGARFMTAVRDAAADNSDANATAKLRQITVAQREIHRLLQWVPERVKALKARDPIEGDHLALHSRRGGL
jgi:hypothetical protein